MSTHTEDGVLRLQQFIIPEIPPTPQISVKASNEPLKQTFAKSGSEVLKQTITKEIPPISQVFVKSSDEVWKQTITPEVPLVKQTFIINDNNESLKQYITKDVASDPSFSDLNKALEEENVDLKRQILDFSSSNAKLTKRITDLEVYIAGLEPKKDKDNSSLHDQIEKLQEKVTFLQKENVVLKSREEKRVKRISKLHALLKEVQEKTTTLEGEDVESKKKLSERERDSPSSMKVFEEKKTLELKCIKLSKQVSDFEKVLFLEKEKLEKERADFETERKSFEIKSTELSVKISDLENILEKERKDFTEMKNLFEKEIKNLKKKNMETFKEIIDKRKFLEKDFESERAYFENAILNLTKRLSGLSTNIMKDQLIKSDLQKKFDLTFKEKNVLINKVKELEDVIFKFDVSKQASHDTNFQTPFVNSNVSECSFKTASSSSFKNISSKQCNRSNDFFKDPIRSTNLFYNSTFDKSDNKTKVPKVNTSNPEKLPVFKKVKMEWRVKGTTPPKKDVPKSFVPPPTVIKKNNAPKGKSSVQPNPIHSVNHLIRLAHKKICCSYCGSNDFVHKNYTPYWYGTYNIPYKKSTHNTLGPKSRWVPKSA